jgi:hypothetical protein
MKKIIIIALALLGSTELFAQSNNALNEAGLTPAQAISNEKMITAHYENLRNVESLKLQIEQSQKRKNETNTNNENVDGFGETKKSPDEVPPITTPIVNTFKATSPSANPRNKEFPRDDASSKEPAKK